MSATEKSAGVLLDSGGIIWLSDGGMLYRSIVILSLAFQFSVLAAFAQIEKRIPDNFSSRGFAESTPPLIENGPALDDQNLEEEHESNGPEGARGIPMERMPASGLFFLLIILFGSGALSQLAVNQRVSSDV